LQKIDTYSIHKRRHINIWTGICSNIYKVTDSIYFQNTVQNRTDKIIKQRVNYLILF